VLMYLLELEVELENSLLRLVSLTRGYGNELKTLKNSSLRPAQTAAVRRWGRRSCGVRRG